jgi:hypothetical protein
MGEALTTSRQFARGMTRVVHAMERDARRAQKQSLARHKELAKLAALDASAKAAQEYEQLVQQLTGAHRVSFQRYDWLNLSTEEPPADATRSDVGEKAAAATLARYRPSWLANTFGFAKRHRMKLADAIQRARVLDDAAYADALALVAKRRREIDFAKLVVSQDATALASALNDHVDFSSVPIEGLTAKFTNGRVIAVLDAYEQDDMPSQSISLLQSGKASFKPLSPTRILELHRDTVCSTVIRTAVEFLKSLPIAVVEVVAYVDLLDPGSGEINAQPIFYCRVAAQAIAAVKLSHAEPTALAERIGAHFDWNKRTGFRPIDLNEYELSSSDLLEEPRERQRPLV